MAVVYSKPGVHRRGEDYVLRRLYRLGLAAAVAPHGSSLGHIEILAPDKRVIATLVVSARTDRSHGGWVMNERHEKTSNPGVFYALVDFEPKEPVTYIVPSSIVAGWLKKNHADWLKEDPTHQDNPVRKLLIGAWLDSYREAWASLPKTTGVKA